jgi:AP2-associated kinase
MHDMKLRHSDIKLENLLYNSPTDIKFCDFGSISYDELDFSKIPPTEYYKYDELFEKNTTQMYRAPEMCDFYRKQIGKLIFDLI